ncbi:hypothetical protein [Mycobacteroides abscessus]|uniref:hypothetical protein n=1 Tax=Mycobacteroides abscessus TaxID=36809 RepID=UPI0012FFE18A|nr:hypothetical protein [Mycobacteroides abscessus]
MRERGHPCDIYDIAAEQARRLRHCLRHRCDVVTRPGAAGTVEGERGGTLLEHLDTSLEEFCCGESETYSQLSCALFVVLDLWPDVVAETDAWARRHWTMQE